MSQPIIVGFIDTPAGHDALELGIALADLEPGRALVVACVDRRFPADAIAPPTGPLEGLLSPARERCAGRPSTEFVMVGERSPAAVLHRLAKDRDAAAIVVGVSHAHGVARILPGSATEQVLHAAPCAVAVAEPGWRRQAAPGTVAVAYDGSVEAEAALARAASIAAARGSELQIVGAVEPVIVWGAGVAMAPVLLLDEEDRLRDRIDEAAARVTGVDAVSVCCREGRPVRVIRDAAADADLLVIGSRAHGPLQRVLLGTVSAPLVRDPPCAMLVLPRTAVPVSRPSVPAAHAEPASGAR